MKKSYEVVVIGGGMIGSSIAYYLAKEKVDVALFESGQIGGKTTRAAAGMLGAHSESNGDFSVFFPFARASQQAYRSLKEKLYALSGVDIGYREGGILKLAFSEQDKQTLYPLLEQSTVEWLDDLEVREMEPKVSPDVIGAAYIPDDVSVMPRSTCEAFAKSAQVLGASIFEHHAVYRVEQKGTNYLLHTANGDVEAEKVVLATGVFSNPLFQQLGLKEKVAPVKGESLIVSHELSILKHTLFHDSCYIVPRNNGTYVVGATMVKNDWSTSISLAGIYELIDKATSMLPDAGALKVVDYTVGLRPATRDGRPFIGVHPEEEGIFIATGHYRNGILLAPGTGQMVRDLVLGKKGNQNLVEAFRVDRHQHTFV